MASAQPIPIASTSKAATRPHAASPAHVASLIGSFTRFSLGMSPGMSDAAFKTMVGSSIEQEHGSLIKSLRGVDADFLSEDMCRDYTCCGLTLKDLHALVEHFEEAHVVVLDPVVPPPHAFSSGGFDLADDMELDEPSPVASTSSTPFPPGPSSVLVHRGWHPNTPAYAPYPPPGRDALRRFREYSSDASECIVPELLFSPSATPSPAGSRDGSPDPSNPRGERSPTTSSKPGTPFQQRVFATRGSMGVIQATDLPPPRPKPFRCPKPGCAKAYKQANGLKYHLQHGQCNFAPMDPNADELKPYICQAGCGKRFKNMSGLRYHYAHSNHGEQGLAMLDAGTHP